MNLSDLRGSERQLMHFMYHSTEVLNFIVQEGKLILKQRIQAKVYTGIMLLLD